MGWAMYAKKTGSCKDCGTTINVGDRIVYFPRHGAYGLDCHTDPRQDKYRARLLKTVAEIHEDRRTLENTYEC